MLEISIMDQEQLSTLPVATLRAYIAAYNLPADDLIEKEDLIDRISASQPLTDQCEKFYRDWLPSPGQRPLEVDELERGGRVNHHRLLHDARMLENTLAEVYGYNFENWEMDVPGHDHLDSVASNQEATPGAEPPKPPAQPSRKPVPSLISLIGQKADVSKLSVGTLKAILEDSCVTYANVIEKSELVERVERLIQNVKAEMAPSMSETASSDHLCKICWDNPINCVLIECGHMATCTVCAKRLMASGSSQCPICREPISRIVHVFRA